MNSDSDQAWHDHAPSSPIATKRRRWPWLLLIVVLVVVAGAGGVYAWPQIEPLLPPLRSAFSGEKVAAADQDAMPELLAAQQKVTDDLAALGQSVAEQQAQLKGMLDQLAALTAKVDALEHPAPPPVPPPPAVAEAPAAPAAQTAPRPHRPPARAPKPTGPISVGGAPLGATAGAGAR